MPAPAKISEKRSRIIELAFERFYDGGFHATGIDTLMADSGISKRTLYKYFPSKEVLIEAVLDHYGTLAAGALFVPAKAASDDVREQIIACFDVRQMMIEDNPRRGCFGIKASQEYIGKHDGIATRGKAFGLHIEQTFIDMCSEAKLANPIEVGKEIAILFQGALLLSQIYGNGDPFTAAKRACLVLLDDAKAA